MGLLRFLAATAPSDEAGGRSPDDDFWYSGLGSLTASGQRISPESAMKLSAVYSCVGAISGDLSSLPVAVYKKQKNGSRIEAPDHPVAQLLRSKPNPLQTTLHWRKATSVHLELRGNSYHRIIPGRRGAYQALLPIHPDRVTVVVTDKPSILYKVRQNDGQTVVYTQDEILHFKGLSSDGILGMSPISAQAEAIGLGLAAQDYGSRFFENDGTPPGVISVAQKLTPEMRDSLRMQFQRSQTGSNRFKVMVLEGGLTYKDIPLKNTDAQFLESRKFSRTEICGIYGVPPHRIGDLERATHSNIEHQGIEYIQYCIGPRATEWENTINATLIEPLRDIYPGDYYAAIDFDALMRGDLPSRYKAYSLAIQVGVLSSNDARRKENLPPTPKGDTYLQPLNCVPYGTAPSAKPSAKPSATPSTAQTADESGAGDEADDDEDDDEAEGADADASK